MPEPFRVVLARAAGDVTEWYGPGATLAPVAVEHRPYSHLMRLAVVHAGHDRPVRHCFLKIFKPKDVPDAIAQMRRRVEHDFATNVRVHEALAGRSGVGAVRPLACYADLLAVVSEEVPGDNLLAHLERHARGWPGGPARDRLGATMADVGRWIRAFQAIDPSDAVVGVDELRDYIDVRLQRLVNARSRQVSPSMRHAVLTHIETLGRAIPEQARRSVAIHADLAPGNVLVADGAIVVLDFAMATRGTWLHDLTRLHVQVALLGAKPWYRPSVLQDLLAHLRRGFAPQLTPADPLFRLLTLLHRVNHMASLTLAPGRLPTRLYNERLCRLHAAWIAADLRSAVEP